MDSNSHQALKEQFFEAMRVLQNGSLVVTPGRTTPAPDIDKDSEAPIGRLPRPFPSRRRSANMGLQ